MSNLYNLFKTVGEVYKFVDCNSKQQAINLSKNNPILIAIYNNTMYYKGKVLTFKRQCAPKENKLIVCKSLPYNLQKGSNYYFNQTVIVNVTKLNAEEIKNIYKHIVNAYNEFNKDGNYDDLYESKNISLSLYIHEDDLNNTYTYNLYENIDTFDDNKLNNFINEYHQYRYSLICRFEFQFLYDNVFPIIISIKDNTTLKNLNNIDIIFPNYKNIQMYNMLSKKDLYCHLGIIRAKIPLYTDYCLYYRKVRRYFKNKEGDKPKHKLKLVRTKKDRNGDISSCIRVSHPNSTFYCYYKGRYNKCCVFPKIFLAHYHTLYYY